MNSPNPIQLFVREEIRKLLEAYCKLTGISSAILDTEGNIIVAVGWQDICTGFHRTYPISCERCIESDLFINSHLNDMKNNLLEYKCKNGLWDVALPISINGKHIATFITGQFFYEDDQPEREFFRAQAKEFGFNEKDYLAALDQVPIFSRSQIGAAMDYYRSLVTLITDAYSRNLHLSLELKEHSRMKRSLQESEATLRKILTLPVMQSS
jgi:ligand-binding sensor protein